MTIFSMLLECVKLFLSDISENERMIRKIGGELR